MHIFIVIANHLKFLIFQQLVALTHNQVFLTCAYAPEGALVSPFFFLVNWSLVGKKPDWLISQIDY